MPGTSTDKFPATIAQWRERLQKSAALGDREVVTHRFMRFWSIYPTILLAHTRLTPNQVTALSVAVYIAGIALFASVSYKLHLAGVGLVFLSIILDHSDGEIARLKGNPSRAGEYVEPVSHDIQYSLLFLPITIGLYRSGSGVAIIYIGFLATIFKLIGRLLEARFLGLQEYLGLTSNSAPSAPSHKSRTRELLQRVYFFINRAILDSTGLIIPLLLCAVFRRLDIFIWLFMVSFGIIFLLRFARQARYISRLHRHFKNEL